MQLSCVKPDQQLLRLQREKLPRLHPCQARKDAATYFRRGCKPKNILTIRICVNLVNRNQHTVGVVILN